MQPYSIIQLRKVSSTHFSDAIAKKYNNDNHEYFFTKYSAVIETTGGFR